MPVTTNTRKLAALLGASGAGIGTDGTLRTAHIGDDQVTGAKIENNPTIAGNLTVSGDLVPATPLSHRNLIINGGMKIWQRATAATTATAAFTTVDRWLPRDNTDGTYTTEKYDMIANDLPGYLATGQSTSLKCVVTGTDTSLASNQFGYIYQIIEAQNLQHLEYGTSGAETITLSFWVKSNKTGTYTIHLNKADTTTYNIPIEYSISSADTWEQKKLTITPTAGSTSLITASGGKILNDNGSGLRVGFGLAWGASYQGTNNTWTASSHFGTSNQVNWFNETNNFYLTGVQLELGSSATPFEHRTYQDELRICQRYYEKTYLQSVPPGTAGTSNSNAYFGSVYYTMSASTHYENMRYKEEKRATPTVVFYSTKTGNTGLSHDHANDTGRNVTIDHGNSLLGGRASISGTDGARSDLTYTAEAELL